MPRVQHKVEIDPYSCKQLHIDIKAQLKAEIDMAEAHKQKCMDKMQEICEKEYSEQLRNIWVCIMTRLFCAGQAPTQKNFI